MPDSFGVFALSISAFLFSERESDGLAIAGCRRSSFRVVTVTSGVKAEYQKAIPVPFLGHVRW